jgi:hypothetical protein
MAREGLAFRVRGALDRLCGITLVVQIVNIPALR